MGVRDMGPGTRGWVIPLLMGGGCTCHDGKNRWFVYTTLRLVWLGFGRSTTKLTKCPTADLIKSP